MKLNKMHAGWEKEDLDTFFETSYFCLHCWTNHDILWRFSNTDPTYELHYCPHQHPNDTGIKENIVDTLMDDLDEAESIIARIKKKTPKMAKKIQKALPKMRKLKAFYETPLQDQIDNQSLPCVKSWVGDARWSIDSDNGFFGMRGLTGQGIKYSILGISALFLPVAGAAVLPTLIVPAAIQAWQSHHSAKKTAELAQYVQNIKDEFLQEYKDDASNFIIKVAEVMLQDPYFVNALCLYENRNISNFDYEKIKKECAKKSKDIVKEMLKNI